MYTRKDYMMKRCTHRQFYAQFVTSSTRDWVNGRIGLERLLRSTDPHLNDISLKLWDSYHDLFKIDGSGKLAAEANGGGISLSDAVCTAKEAARQLIEEATNHERQVAEGDF